MASKCTAPNCEPCASVIPFDAARADRYADMLARIATELSEYPPRIMLGADPAVVIPSYWEDDTPLQYVTPTTD